MKPALILILFLAGAASGAIEKRFVGSKSCKTDRQYHVQIDSAQHPLGHHCLPLWRTGSSKKLTQTIKLEQQFTYKDEEGRKHDIMLIKLNEDVSAKLPVISLPPSECSKPEEGQQVEVGGWGAKTADVMQSKKPKSLKCGKTDLAACGEADKPDDKYFSDPDTIMCAFKAGVEACSGDGGTAVEYNNVLHGIVVSDPVDKCANPIVIANVCHYRKWIDETIRANS
ncbi:anionic trypsin-2-like [Solea senegalensis]|uniref:Anionic trypsin-2-like n=1 Tax=Solea senegalensis TaxID=28829 RepID=A0AAV6QGU3_SOLSE|nr:anionic trypsin-2-like [Solea senegalensis]